MLCLSSHQMGNNLITCNFSSVRLTLIRISMRIRACWSESSLSTCTSLGSLAIYRALSKDSIRLRRYADWWVFTVCLRQVTFSHVAIHITCHSLRIVHSLNSCMYGNPQNGIILCSYAYEISFPITKTRLFKYTEKLITEKLKIFRQKIQIFFIFLLKT